MMLTEAQADHVEPRICDMHVCPEAAAVCTGLRTGSFMICSIWDFSSLVLSPSTVLRFLAICPVLEEEWQRQQFSFLAWKGSHLSLIVTRLCGILGVHNRFTLRLVVKHNKNRTIPLRYTSLPDTVQILEALCTDMCLGMGGLYKSVQCWVYCSASNSQDTVLLPPPLPKIREDGNTDRPLAFQIFPRLDLT